jgi:DUF1365 family protein
MSHRRMQSCLYECRVMHHRFAPKEHRFLYRIFLFAIDLDELDTLPGRLALFSVNRAGLYSFRENDYLPTHEKPHQPEAPPPSSTGASLKARVIAYLAANGVDLAGGRVVLVTLPRVFGYLFNPVSFYFCYDQNGAPVAAVTEVTNTFKEMKPYFIAADRGDQGTEYRRPATGDSYEAVYSGLSPDSRHLSPGSPSSPEFQLRTPKYFYVSPYSDVDVAFDFKLRSPGENLCVQIDDYAGSQRMLTSTLTGPRRELTTPRLAWFTLKYPLITLKIISLIHWHAFQLWLKRVPWFAKSARAGDQRGLYRPHASIAPVPPVEPPAGILSTGKPGNY